MTLTQNGKDYIANNFGLNGCFVASGLSWSYTDVDDNVVSETGGTAQVVSRLVMTALVKSVTINNKTYTYNDLKTANDNKDVTLTDAKWIAQNDGDPDTETQYCAGGATPTPTPTPTPTATPSPTPVPGDYALSFGGDDKVVIENSNGIIGSEDEMTVSVWVNLDDQISGKYTYHKDIVRSNCGGGGGLWGISTSGDYNTSRRIVFLVGWVTGSGKWYAPAEAKAEKGAWTNIVLVMSRKTGDVKVYTNGTLVDSTTLTVGDKQTTSKVNIGWDCGGYLKGIIDELIIYNRALTDQEIRDLYYGKTISTYRLAGYWKFDEGTGTVAKDSSGNGNDGTIDGAVYVKSTRPSPTPTPTPAPHAIPGGQFEFVPYVGAPTITLDLTGLVMRQNPVDYHFEMNNIKITNTTSYVIYIAMRVKLFKGALQVCPASGEVFDGLDRTEARNVRIKRLDPGETATYDADFYQPPITGVHTVCLIIHGDYDRDRLEQEISNITG